MPSEGSVTRWLRELQAGDLAAVQQLWERYFRRLVGLARGKLGHASRAIADEEDVALSAFHSFCQGVDQGRFPKLDDRDDLWRLLVAITERKAIGLQRRERRQKRGGGAVLAEAELSVPGADSTAQQGIDQVAGREPTPEFAPQVAEECKRLLEELGDDELRSIAVWKMEGDTTEQIAARLGKAPRTVERKLRMIRSLWGEGEEDA